MLPPVNISTVQPSSSPRVDSVSAPAAPTPDSTFSPGDAATSVSARDALAHLPADCDNPARAQLAVDTFADNLTLSPDLVHHAGTLVWAAGTTRDVPGSEGLVTPWQGLRALTALTELPPAVRTEVDAILDACPSRGQRAIVLKELAALHGRADAADIPRLLRRVRVRVACWPLSWMIQRTTVYGLKDRPGIREAMSIGCRPITGLLAQAENQPSIALDIWDSFERKPATQSWSAEYEIEIIEQYGGSPAPRGLVGMLRSMWNQAFGPVYDLGLPVKMPGYFDAVLESAGIDLCKTPWLQVSDKLIALETLEKYVRLGIDIPVVSGRIERTQQAGQDAVEYGRAHAEAIVDCFRKDGVRTWRIHDPWTGESRELTDESFFSRDDAILVSRQQGRPIRSLPFNEHGYELIHAWWPSPTNR